MEGDNSWDLGEALRSWNLLNSELENDEEQA